MKPNYTGCGAIVFCFGVNVVGLNADELYDSTRDVYMNVPLYTTIASPIYITATSSATYSHAVVIEPYFSRLANNYAAIEVNSVYL